MRFEPGEYREVQKKFRLFVDRYAKWRVKIGLIVDPTRNKVPLFKDRHNFHSLWMLHNPTNREQYRLRGETQRLASHFKAFQQYYNFKEKPSFRLVSSLTKKNNRVGKLIRRCETRLDVAICRVGWCLNIITARR